MFKNKVINIRIMFCILILVISIQNIFAQSLAVTDLSAVTGQNSYEVRLIWTYPGPFTIPVGSRYEIQKSTFESIAWSTGTSGNLVLSTGSVNSGNRQNYVITGLQSDKLYYFRIWVSSGPLELFSGVSNNTTAYPLSDPSKLLILVPGETQNPGSSTGKSGTPISRFTAGQPFAITIKATDLQWNTISDANPIVYVESTDQYGSKTNYVCLINGSSITTITVFNAEMAGLTGYATHYVKAYPTEALNYNGNDIWLSTGTSSEIRVYPNLVTRYHVILPNEVPAPGKPPYGENVTQQPIGDGTGGKNYSVSFQTAGVVFPVTVRVTDNYYNLCSTAVMGGVSVTVTDPYCSYSRSQGLTMGQNVWNNVMMNTASTWTVRATGSLGTYDSNIVNIIPGSAKRLRILAPGELPDAGNISTRGRMSNNYPTSHKAGESFNVTVDACDDYYNSVTTTGINVSIITDDLYDTHPSTKTLFSGTTTFGITLVTKKNTIITATTDYCSNYKYDYTQSIAITTNVPYRIQILVPGETHVDGKVTGSQPGKTEASNPTAQVAGVGFKTTVLCLDQCYNQTDENPTLTLMSDGADGDPNDPQVTGRSIWVSNGQYILDDSEKWVFSTSSNTGWRIRMSAFSWVEGEGYPGIMVNSQPSSKVPVVSNTASKLLVLLPGQNFDMNSPYGKTGSPSQQTAGAPFDVTVAITDSNFNIVSGAEGTIVLYTPTDPYNVEPAQITITGTDPGYKTASFTTGLKRAATYHYAVAEELYGTYTKYPNSAPDYTVSTFTVLPGTPNHLQIILPGETPAWGLNVSTANGKTGSPVTQTAGTVFEVTVNLVDNYYNTYNKGIFPSLPGITMPEVTVETNDPYDANSSTSPLGDISASNTFQIQLKTAATWHMLWTKDVDGSDPRYITDVSSRQFTVNPSSPAFLLVVVPGETHVPGKWNIAPYGRTDTQPTVHTAGDAFNIDVVLTDIWYNRIMSGVDMPSCTVTTWDYQDSEPTIQCLAFGSRAFSVRPLTASSSWTCVSVDWSTAAVKYTSKESSQIRIWPDAAYYMQGTSYIDPVRGSTWAYAGSDYNVRINVKDRYHNICSTGSTRYTGEVQFLAEIAPTDFDNSLQNPEPLPGSGGEHYVFTDADAGSHLFTIQLKKAGTRWINWRQSTDSLIDANRSGYSNRPVIEVRPGDPSKFAFAIPSPWTDPIYVKAGISGGVPNRQQVKAFIADSYENQVSSSNISAVLSVVDVFGSSGTIKDASGNVITSTTTDSNGEVGGLGKELYYEVSTTGGHYAKVQVSTAAGATITGKSVNIMTTGGDLYRFQFVTTPSDIEASAGNIKSTVFTFEKRDYWNNPTGETNIVSLSIGTQLKTDSPSVLNSQKKYWNKTTDTMLSMYDVAIPIWSAAVWPVPAANSQASFRYSDMYASWPAGEDGSQGTATAALPARPSIGKWTASVEYGIYVGSTTFNVNPGAITQVGFDVIPSTTLPLLAGIVYNNQNSLQVLEIETQDTYGNPKAVNVDTTMNLQSDSGAGNSLRIDYLHRLTFESEVDTIATTEYGRNYSFSLTSSPWMHTSTASISAGQYATQFWYADTKASKTYPPYNIAASTMPHVKASSGSWETPGSGQYVPITASPIKKLAIISSHQILAAGTTSSAFLLQTQDKFSNPSPVITGEEVMSIFDLNSTGTGNVRFASPNITSGWVAKPAVDIVTLNIGDDTTSFYMIDTNLGNFQITAQNPAKTDWAVAVQTYSVVAGNPHHFVFITESRRLIAGTTIAYTGSGNLGSVVSTYSVQGYNPFSSAVLPVPLSSYSNRVQTVTVITIQLRDQSDNVTISSDATSIVYTCTNSTSARAGENPLKNLMLSADWPSICEGGFLPGIIPPGSSEHSIYFFDTKAGTSTLRAEGTCGSIQLVSATQNQYITPAPARFFTIHHSYPLTNPLPVNSNGTVTVKARDRFGNVASGDSTNGQYYKGIIKFAHTGSTTAVTLRAMPGSATYYAYTESDSGVWQGLQVINQMQESLKISATHYASPVTQALDYPADGVVYGWTNDSTRVETAHSDANLVTSGIKVTPILDPENLLRGSNYLSRVISKKVYQGDGDIVENFQPFGMAGLTMVTLPVEANLTEKLEQIKVEKFGNTPSSSISKMSLYYDASGNYYFDPELVSGGQPTDTKLCDAEYDAGTDAWYFRNLSVKPEVSVNTLPKTYFIAVRIATSATTGTYFGLRLQSYQSIQTSGTIGVSQANFEIVTTTWAVEKSPPKVYAQLTDIAAYYQLEGTTQPITYSYMQQGESDIGMLRVAFSAPMFQGAISEIKVGRTGTGQDYDIVGVKIYMDGKDSSPNDGRIDAGSNPNGALEPGGDDALTNWVPFTDRSAQCMLSTPQLIDCTSRYFFITYKIENSATPGYTHGAQINGITLLEGAMQSYASIESTKVVVTATVDELNVYNVNKQETSVSSVNFTVTGVVTQGDANITVMKLTMATVQRTGLWGGLKLDRSIYRNATSGVPEGTLSLPTDVDKIQLWYDSNNDGMFEVTDSMVVDQNPQFSLMEFPVSELAESINESASVIEVADIGVFFPPFCSVPKAPGKLIIDDNGDPSKLEIVTYTGVDEDNNLFTGVVRGQDKTTAKSHTSGAIVSGPARLDIVGDVSGVQEIRQTPKNYFITFDYSPVCTVDASLKLGVEIPSTGYFTINSPDYMGNVQAQVGLRSPRNNQWIGTEWAATGWTESYVSQVKEYPDDVLVKPTDYIYTQYLVQGSVDNVMAQFTLETDLSEALWYAIRIYSTGTASYDGGAVQEEVPVVKVWYDANNDRMLNKSPVTPYFYAGTDYDVLVGSGTFSNAGDALATLIRFNSSKVQEIITAARAGVAKSQRYFITYDISETALTTNPRTGDPKNLGVRLTAESFPTDEDNLVQTEDDFISEPDNLDDIGLPWKSTLKTIASSPRTIFVKSAPIFSDDDPKETGTLSTYEVPRLSGNLSAGADVLYLFSNDSLGRPTPTLAIPASGYAVIESEIIKYTGKTANSITGITRGVLGSFAASHSSGVVFGVQVTQGVKNFAVEKLDLWADGFQVEMGTITITRTTPSYLLFGADSDLLNIKVYRDDNGNSRLDRFASPEYRGIVTADTLVGSGVYDNSRGRLYLNDPAINRGYILVTTTPTAYFITYDVSPSAKFSHPLISWQNEIIGAEITGEDKIGVNHPSEEMRHRVSTYVPIGLGEIPAFPIKTANMPIVATVDTVYITPSSELMSTVERYAENVPVIQLSMKTNRNTALWESIKVNLTGTGVDADVSKIKIWKVITSTSEYSVFESTVMINSQPCGLITYGSDTFTEKAATLLLKTEDNYYDARTITATLQTYYLTYDISQFAQISKTVGASILDKTYFTVQVPDGVEFLWPTAPFITQTAEIKEVQVAVSATVSDSAYYVHFASGAFQSQSNVEMMRLKLRTDKSNCNWDAIQVERTGTGGPLDQTKPEGRNSDVKYIKIFRDANYNNILDADDQCISEAETKISSLCSDGVYYNYISIYTPLPFDLIVESTITLTGTFPTGQQQLLVKAGDEIMRYSLAGTTITPTGPKPFLRIVERGKYGTVRKQLNSGDLIKKVDMFDLSNDLSKTKMIYLTNIQKLNPSNQTYFIAYDMGDNAVAGNTIGLKIPDSGWIKLRLPHDVSPLLVLETNTGVQLGNSTSFDYCKTSLLPVTPIGLIVKSENYAPVYTKYGSKNVPLMLLRLKTNTNHALLTNITLKQTGTVETSLIPGKGQGDFSCLSIWKEATSAAFPYGDGKFDATTDVFISSIPHSTGANPNMNFVSGMASLSIESTGLYISTAEVKLYIVGDVGYTDLSMNSTENDYTGIRLEEFSGLTIVPQTMVSDKNNTFPYKSSEFRITNISNYVDLPKVEITAPKEGEKISGNRITLTSEITSGESSDIRYVYFQYRKASEDEWHNIYSTGSLFTNPDATYPYNYFWDVSNESDFLQGNYQLRCVAYDKTGNYDNNPETVNVVIDRISPDMEEKIQNGVPEKTQKIYNNVENSIKLADINKKHFTEIIIPEGALSGSFDLVKVAINPLSIPSSDRKYKSAGMFRSIELASGQKTLLKNVTIIIAYADEDNDGIIDDTDMREENIKILYYDESSRIWKKDSETTVDKINNTASIQVGHFSLFGIFAAASNNLDNVLVYPNPYVPYDGADDNGIPYSQGNSQSGIVFENLTEAVKIYIYTVSGELVFDSYIESSGTFNWDVKNNNGSELASGGYLAVIVSSTGERKVFKLGIIK
ncbi:MAG: hypothetical protein A2252_08050 [Elusimicrobia bacterium RIFOXYA2_FULL_39_19]|nr:MAG: hypothetical protein A2252_08050 [Elusimicrobia bacterium RIFOXYA2_FULL_39_19]